MASEPRPNFLEPLHRIPEAHAVPVSRKAVPKRNPRQTRRRPSALARTPSEKPMVKKRGRPKGSKNKKPRKKAKIEVEPEPKPEPEPELEPETEPALEISLESESEEPLLPSDDDEPPNPATKKKRTRTTTPRIPKSKRRKKGTVKNTNRSRKAKRGGVAAAMAAAMAASADADQRRAQHVPARTTRRVSVTKPAEPHSPPKRVTFSSPRTPGWTSVVSRTASTMFKPLSKWNQWRAADTTSSSSDASNLSHEQRRAIRTLESQRHRLTDAYDNDIRQVHDGPLLDQERLRYHEQKMQHYEEERARAARALRARRRRSGPGDTLTWIGIAAFLVVAVVAVTAFFALRHSTTSENVQDVQDVAPAAVHATKELAQSIAKAIFDERHAGGQATPENTVLYSTQSTG